MLIFLVLVVGSLFMFFVWWVLKVGLGGSFDFIFCELLFLVNNVLLIVVVVVVLIGMIYLFCFDVFDFGKILVGVFYFEVVFVLLMVLFIVFIGIGFLVCWKLVCFGDIFWLFCFNVVIVIVLVVLLLFFFGCWFLLILGGIVLGVWIIGVSVV